MKKCLFLLTCLLMLTVVNASAQNYEKVDKERIKETKSVEKIYSITHIERMIKTCGERIIRMNEEKAKWEALKQEAEKLGVVREEAEVIK